MAGSQLSIKDKISPPAVEGKSGLQPPQTGESHLQPGSPRRSLAKLGGAIMGWDALLAP